MSLREELISFQKEKKKIETKIFSQILEQCIEQIKYENEHSKTDTFFKIPKFILGLPLNDMKKCISYILSELKKQGLYCKISTSNEIYISWKINDSETDIIKENKIINKNNNYDIEDIQVISKIFKEKKLF